VLTRRSAYGFTLLEALIAIAVMITGFTGTAAMLLQTIRQERESSCRRAAIRIASSMADQLRTLRRPDDRPVLAITGIDPATACAANIASCAPEQAAERMRIAWVTETALSLPQGSTIVVTVPNPLAAEYLIAVRWPAGGGDAGIFRLAVTT
jgi:type IV pilus assembly protein PilV